MPLRKALRRRRWRQVRDRPTPPEWEGILERTTPLYRRMSPADRIELLGHVAVFLDEKNFEGCGGLEMTDEIRVTVAANACVLLLHRETEYFPEMTSVFVYPDEFYVDVAEDDGGVVSEYRLDRTGESWDRGPVVLSWEDITGDFGDPSSPYNVVIHEFAHQLDLENGHADGVPRLEKDQPLEEWARVFNAAFEKLEDDIDDGRRTLVDEYALEDAIEFFAVMVETFFESPAALKKEYRDLYGELSRYFKQDPAAWRAD